MEKAMDQVLDTTEIASLYNRLSEEWLLLEVLKKNSETGKLEKFKLVAHSKNKDDLYDLMENDEWNWNKKYLFVYADPTSLCDI